MIDVANEGPDERSGQEIPSAVNSSRKLLLHLILLYVQGSAVAVVVTFLLGYLGLQLTGYQWVLLLSGTPLAVAAYVIPDIYFIARHFRPIGTVLEQLDKGEDPTASDISKALVRALNLPFYSFIRVTFIHGPGATSALSAVLVALNIFFDAGYEVWQILTFAATVLFFAAPTHAILEYFAISRHMVPTIERLWKRSGGLDVGHIKDLVAIKLREKLLYLSVFIAAFPLVFFAGSIVLKVDLLLSSSRDLDPNSGAQDALLWPETWVLTLIERERAS